MRNFLLFCLSFLIMSNLYAQEATSFTVLERKAKSNRTYFKEVVLEDLEGLDSFDGKYFKIVKGKSNTAIAFNDPDRELVLKAANTYYHLSKARKYWRDEFKIGEHLDQKKLVVRLEISNLFDEQGHFANDKRDPQFNNALSIPEGETPSWLPAEKQDKWGKEIWFRPMKKIDTSTLSDDLGENPLTASLRAVEGYFLSFAQDQFAYSILERIFYPSYASGPILKDIVRFVGTVAMTKAVIEASKHTDSLFVVKWYYLDTAMVPEVIYHEYAHILLSDSLNMSHSTPVVEGMADYFAAAITDKKKVYAPVSGYSNSRAKDPNNKQPYRHWYESNHMAAADFTLSVLWDVRDVLGEEYATKVIYKARTLLKTESATINEHLLRAILTACETECELPRRDKFKLYEAFSAKGF